MKIFTLLLLFVLSGSVMFAQITINKSNVDANFTNVQRTQISVRATDPNPLKSADLGTASSSAQSWDFSNIVTTNPNVSRDTSMQNYVPAAGEWYASEFPSASVCGKFSFSFSGGGFTQTTSYYQYYSSETDGAYNLGSVMRQQISPPPPPGWPFPADTSIVTKIRPKELGFPLPMTLGTTRTATDTVDNSATEIEVKTRSFNVNGFGNVKYPDGTTRPALRVVVDNKTMVYDNGSFIAYGRSLEIVFIAQDMSAINFDVDTAYTNGTAIVYGYDYDLRAGGTDVTPIDRTVPAEFSLAQNYPNPFNPSTKIEFQLPAYETGNANTGLVTLKVYDVLGQEVSTLVNEQLHPGTYSISFDATHLAGGMYMYRLTAGNTSVMKKMVLMK